MAMTKSTVAIDPFLAYDPDDIDSSEEVLGALRSRLTDLRKHRVLNMIEMARDQKPSRNNGESTGVSGVTLTKASDRLSRGDDVQTWIERPSWFEQKMNCIRS